MRLSLIIQGEISNSVSTRRACIRAEKTKGGLKKHFKIQL
jgi:hypothetical protein